MSIRMALVFLPIEQTAIVGSVWQLTVTPPSPRCVYTINKSFYEDVFSQNAGERAPSPLQSTAFWNTQLLHQSQCHYNDPFCQLWFPQWQIHSISLIFPFPLTLFFLQSAVQEVPLVPQHSETESASQSPGSQTYNCDFWTHISVLQVIWLD